MSSQTKKVKVFLLYNLANSCAIPVVFDSKNKILKYFQKLYPRAKHLRLKIDEGKYGWHDNIYIYNYTTPVLNWPEKIIGTFLWNEEIL